MSKADYIRLAKAVQAMRQTNCFNVVLDRLGPSAYADILETVIDQIALACGDQQRGGKFDYDRFDTACRS